ncbi:MAG: zf-HC2 domain-containing protein [Deltaproteobacteria bacterium]|nr:zf-HC2 domain-containing protein [Deltaproteobacteria bacterium]
MNCKTTRKLLADYIIGDVTPLEKAQIDEHLKRCLSCKKKAKEISSLFKMISSYTVEEIESGVFLEIKNNIIKELQRKRRFYLKIWDWLWLKPIRPAFVSLIILTLLFFLAYPSIVNHFSNTNNYSIIISSYIDVDSDEIQDLDKEDIDDILAVILPSYEDIATFLPLDNDLSDLNDSDIDIIYHALLYQDQPTVEHSTML